MGDPSPEDYKLCGFFLAVLATSSPPPASVSPGRPCSLSSEDAGFVAEDGALLLPISDGSSGRVAEARETPDGNSPRDTGSCTPSSSRKRRRRGIGLVKGSMSVVHQVHALAVQRCVEVRGRLVAVSDRGGDGGARVVVLVDVYLPMEVWSGWQFPRSGAVAAALFKHVSCDWQMRNSLHAFESDQVNCLCEDELIWTRSDCHVLKCKLHCGISDLNIKLFDLHEVFTSLPSIIKDLRCSTRIMPENASCSHGISDVSDDVLTNVLASIGPRDLVSVASTCRHLRYLASSIIPDTKLALFPHQKAAVEWMLKRELHPKTLEHPIYMNFSTEDGFNYYINAVSGQLETGMAPTIKDFRGGMFCDEPGLGKTVTALSLILKTHGTLADPPHGVDVTWCMHSPVERCGYYELTAGNFSNDGFMSAMKRFMTQNARRGDIFSTNLTSDMISSGSLKVSSMKRSFDSCAVPSEPSRELEECLLASSKSSVTADLQYDRSLSNKKIINTYGRSSSNVVRKWVGRKSNGRSNVRNSYLSANNNVPVRSKKHIKSSNCVSELVSNETWVQCDACKKWRKLSDVDVPDALEAWFCSMNSDHLHQSCAAPEECWDYCQPITSLPGFYTKGTTPGKEQNVSFFLSVLKEHFGLIDTESKKALLWLANLSCNKISEMETAGLTLPVVGIRDIRGQVARGYEKIFQAFGLVREVVRGTARWYYQSNLDNLAFDTSALQVALTKPMDSFRLYLSRATLIIVPANLIEHWKTQIQKVARPGRLHVFVWSDHKRPCAHNLAWDYDIIITTFSRLSAEWSPRKRSVLMQVHWLRVILDEGHTLGSSLSLTNKLQMAISLTASNRWILTGTPTPNTPNSQLNHLQPMLKFLHEEAYGKDQESWDAGILKPFEAEMQDGRIRLLQLLQRTMISARKKDLKAIPPCNKRVTFLHFNEEHAKSYNELVVTVRRNILMADWNDPSHIESLLNPKQWKFRSNTIRNIRLSCCVAGHIKMAEAGNDIQDTMDILVQQGLDPLSEEYALIRSSLLNGGNCSRCKDWCRLPVITPCRHLLCLECVSLDSERCTFPGCRNSYEMQFMLTRPENPNPKWPVPKDLIELQPSYRQDNWDPDWQSTSSSKVAYLVKRLKDLQESNRNIGCNKNDIYEDEVLLPFQNDVCALPMPDVAKTLNSTHCMTKPDKVIIFSQFLEHIHAIEQQLTIAGIKFAGMYSPMHSSNKMKSLMIFQHDADCLALLMDGSAALGLDLSFVSHVFLMEPIWDRSMEEQVISRAHRMGATRQINVETLAMHSTIEEQMLKFLQDTSEGSALKEQLYGADLEETRAHRTLHDFAESNYLAHLGFVKTNID